MAIAELDSASEKEDLDDRRDVDAGDGKLKTPSSSMDRFRFNRVSLPPP
jgi:hypothetical protein